MKKQFYFPLFFLFAGLLIYSCGTPTGANSSDKNVNQGYGTVKESERTVAVSQTKVGENESSTVSWMELFQRTPGVTVRGSGRSLSLQIRGKKSMNNQGQPLFIVDNQILGNGFEYVSFLDPSEVDRISVLKDAASTASYGMRGADGVILITLKK